MKGHKETFEGERDVLFLDYSDGFVCMYTHKVFQNFKLRKLIITTEKAK